MMATVGAWDGAGDGAEVGAGDGAEVGAWVTGACDGPDVTGDKLGASVSPATVGALVTGACVGAGVVGAGVVGAEDTGAAVGATVVGATVVGLRVPAVKLTCDGGVTVVFWDGRRSQININCAMQVYDYIV